MIFRELKKLLFSDDVVSVDKHITLTRNKIVQLFCIIALLTGVAIIFLSPPMSCPDENAHFMNICRIANGNLFVDVKDNVVGSNITLSQAEFIQNYLGRYNGLAAEKYNFSEMYFQSHLTFGTEPYFYLSDLSSINPIAYIIPSFGVAVTNTLFNITSPYNMLVIAKLCNLMFYIIVTAYALKITPWFRNTMFLISLMPMSIYQAASTSYDSPLIACSFLLFAFIAKILSSEKEYTITKGDIVGVCFSCFFIFGTKIAYATLILVLLSIGIKKFGSLKRYFFCIGLVCLTGVISYLTPTMIINNITFGAGAENELIALQREYVMSNIGAIPDILLNTIKYEFRFWIFSFFGILGNLDTNFPVPFIIFYLCLLLFTMLSEASMTAKFGFKVHLLPLVSIFVFLVGSVMTMYLEWTPMVLQEIGGPSATGMQGRYFIPLAIYGGLILLNPLFNKFRYSNVLVKSNTTVCSLTAITYCFLTALILLVRFWI